MVAIVPIFAAVTTKPVAGAEPVLAMVNVTITLFVLISRDSVSVRTSVAVPPAGSTLICTLAEALLERHKHLE